MNIEVLTQVFMWGVLINVGLYTFWVIMLLALSDQIYAMHSRFFNISRETYNTAIYAFLAGYKIIVVGLFLVPWLALLIVG